MMLGRKSGYRGERGSLMGGGMKGTAELLLGSPILQRNNSLAICRRSPVVYFSLVLIFMLLGVKVEVGEGRQWRHQIT